jgi:hypothetical protein
MKIATAVEKRRSLEAILAEAWAMLTRAVANAGDPFHTPVLGTSRPSGCNLRTVVLRQADRHDRVLMCHSDLRASKVQEIQSDPRVSWLFYHPQENVQLRIAGQATLHTGDELADQQWAATKLMSRRLYCALDAPGTPAAEATSGLPDFLISRSPTLVESEAGRKNFAVIACRADFIDWLLLNAQGNWRAWFTWHGDELTATWVSP